MSERRFFVESLSKVGEEQRLNSKTARHLYVLRIPSGTHVLLFDRCARHVEAELVSLDEHHAVCRILRDIDVTPHSARLVLVQCLPKGSKLELSIRMATELGVHAIHLAVSERTISRPDRDRHKSRHARLARIAQEASEQAQRDGVPEIAPAAPLHEVAGRAPIDAGKIVFWEASQVSLDAGPRWEDMEEAWIIIGPEGGLSQTEICQLEGVGYTHHGLGRTILRVDTAVPVAIALVADRLGLWGNGAQGKRLIRPLSPC
ncbi:MAG: 16S rRNA (uracil(1498)-N(3))-methyltransferase [Myxococcales bacterium]|nr:16S rRNA (uracil(1498)-N(3))-methyltransferase [Myxococcales bacterium]MCB9708928.1 16S rRNA (uracil(1498)-N(3))-methyltransferase [Myxococcales bacterium]